MLPHFEINHAIFPIMPSPKQLNLCLSYNSSLTFPPASNGIQRAGVVPVIRYSHFSGSDTVKSSFSSPQDRSIYGQMSKSTSTRITNTHLYTSLWTIPALYATSKLLTRIILRCANFLVNLPGRKVAKGVHGATRVCPLSCFPEEANLVRVAGGR